MREHPTQREWGPRGTTRELYDFLASVPATAVVVADAGVSRLVPSMSGRATLAMSERATGVFYGDEGTAYGRLRARADFFATDAGAARRAGLAVRYGLTHAVFRRRWISAGSENRWLRGAAGPGFVLLSSTPARRTATADRELLLQSLSPDASIVFENADYFVVELSAATVDDVVAETFGTGDWSAAFDVSPPASVSKDTEVVAGAVRYPGARVYFHPPPVALGATAFPVWTSGGEIWEDAPTDVRVVLQMRGACDLEAVEIRPYLPSGRREVLELTVGDLSVRRVARHKAPIVLNLDGGRRDSIELRVRSMLGASFGLTELRLHARVGSCDAQWKPFGEPEWPQVEPSVSDGMLLARRYPHRAAAALPLANALAEADLPEDALAVLRQAISGARPETVSRIEQGLLQDAVGDFDGALASFEAAVATDSNNAWARGCLAWAELRKRSVVSAVWHAVSAIRLDHDYADAYTILAGAAKRLGLRAAARSLLERSLVMDRYLSWGYLELARMIDEDGDREGAVGILEEFLVLVPFDSDARALLAAFSEAPAES
jgi:tetratricopeptide (TPR) repeat protein